MNKVRKSFSILLLLSMLIGVLSACAPKNNTTNEDMNHTNNSSMDNTSTDANTTTDDSTTDDSMDMMFDEQPFGENLPTEPTTFTPLVVAYQDFSQKFSPFFSDTGYDADVAGMTQIGLLTTDRVGGVIFNAIEGETVSYNGTDYLYKGPADVSVKYDDATDTTKYTARLRVGMQFSDGEPVTADDIIFTYYTFLDPSYVGSTTLSSYDIIGLKDYQTQTTSDVFDLYNTMAGDIYAAGIDHEWSDADAWTQEQQDDFWAKVTEGWMKDVQDIITTVNSNYLSYAEAWSGGVYTAEDISGIEGMEIMFGMFAWGFGDINEDGSFTTAYTEQTFDLVEQFPTLEDYYNETYVAYEGNVEEYAGVESPNGVDVLGNAMSKFIGYWGPLDESMGGEGVPNIAGIVKVDDYTVEVTVNGFSAPAIYSILGIPVTPLHYYGDAAKYDYENNMFGFDFGDLSKQESLTATPMGAGAYKYIQYDNRVVYFEANPFYYRGCPKIAEIQFKETASAEVPSAVQTGTADAGEMSYNASRYAEVQSYNSNGELSGDVISASKVDNQGYGYIGINAATVLVGEDSGSEASKALRKALATVFAVYRDVGIDSYYGSGASVINYPISNTSWAAPQPTDEDYKLAFSTDVNGDPIYTADMTLDEKYAAASAAALGYFEAAGFTVEGGVLTAAPEGARLSYEVIVPGDGTGDHPAFTILTAAQEAFAALGMELVINDPADANILWDALDAGTQDLWTAAWGTTIDPDMYQIYHSSNVVGLGGSDSNHYHIQDATLDDLILEARTSDDQSFRKAVYKQALEIVMDWAVEIPNYQRQNVIIFSTERINIDTLTPDMTTFWGWLNDIELIDMN
jgi:peptide/nickel transport system substrate-binding protein